MRASGLIALFLVLPMASCSPPEADPNAVDPLGRCQYVNGFTSDFECREYLGSNWSLDAMSEDCSVPVPGSDPGAFELDLGCDKSAIKGQCLVDPGTVESYTIVFPASEDASCRDLSIGCFFAGGEWTPAAECGGVDPVVGEENERMPFEPMAQVCVDPLPGDPPGDGPDGQICTYEGISAATEENRHYLDYASCGPVMTQRPYYAAPRETGTASDDPRYEDPEWMAEYAWVTGQVESSACVCCHSVEGAPEAGPSNWYLGSEGFWVDALSDDGLAMMAGWVDSTAFGAFEPEDNNGFERTVTGTPTTDTARMVAFLTGELDRRGLVPGDFADTEPFGGPLYQQMIFEPEACASGQGMDAEGRLLWSGGPARYVYVLEPGSENPGVPPNRDMPEGTVWRVDVPPTAAPMDSGLAYGTVPSQARQALPASGQAPALVSGQTYYLYALLDVAAPLTRCLFEAP